MWMADLVKTVPFAPNCLHLMVRNLSPPLPPKKKCFALKPCFFVLVEEDLPLRRRFCFDANQKVSSYKNTASASKKLDVASGCHVFFCALMLHAVVQGDHNGETSRTLTYPTFPLVLLRYRQEFETPLVNFFWCCE